MNLMFRINLLNLTNFINMTLILKNVNLSTLIYFFMDISFLLQP
jgi:hypothetical protein